MSYDICLKDKDGAVIQLPCAHQQRGGTYAIGGTTEAWLNVTYNYGEILRRVLGEKGIRSIYGMTGKESLAALTLAACELKDDNEGDYWKPTEGNVKRALISLATLAMLAPDGIWSGD